jgi:uncharacterized repeat protein (TIGR03803 family)
MLSPRARQFGGALQAKSLEGDRRYAEPLHVGRNMFRTNVSKTPLNAVFVAEGRPGSSIQPLRLTAAALLLLILAAPSAFAQFSVVYTFSGGVGGAFPATGLIQDAAGNLYGIAGNGGIAAPRCHQSCGVVYEVAPSSSTETVLYDFVGSTKGYYPDAGLIRDSQGNLYGTTDGGGDTNACVEGQGGAGCGVVFDWAPPAISSCCTAL